MSEAGAVRGPVIRPRRLRATPALRRMARETLVRIESARRPEGTLPLPDESLIYKDLRETLDGIVEDLPRQQKAVYRLSREARLRQEEIASRLHISLPTVKNHLGQALRTIREKMEKYHLSPVVALLVALMYSL